MNRSVLENKLHTHIVEVRNGQDFLFDPDASCDEARKAQAAWATLSIRHRLKIVARFRELLAEQSLIAAHAANTSPPRLVSEILASEIIPLAEACRFLEREAESILASRHVGRSRRPLWLAGVRSEVHREPFGLVLIIAPSNYPLFLPGVQLLQALVAGNAVLLKPGAGGTAAAQELNRLLNAAGLPLHLLQLLPEQQEAAQTAIAAGVDKVFFTGSARVGREILAQLAPAAVPSTMELSGCDAVIVRSDADIELAVRGIVFGLRLNSSRTCIAPRRVIVSRAIATEFEGRLTQAIADCSILIPEHRSQRLQQLVQEAIDQGAHLLSGVLHRDGTLTGPVIVAGVKPGLALLREDIFAPMVAILTAESDEEALRLANDCPFALGATIFSRDVHRAQTIATRLGAGLVVINDIIAPSADARLPFGGRKLSGFGLTRGPEGLLEMTTAKVVMRRAGRLRPHFDAPRQGDEEMFLNYIAAAHSRGIGTRFKSAIRLIRTVFKQR
ncbi:MAG TPA: aldehyde dehydrogenase family protein [Verrucomicrobiota bacterium]|nr:aldehyde dehydrogenase family protein [Verrucomicrobiota bacterium]